MRASRRLVCCFSKVTAVSLRILHADWRHSLRPWSDNAPRLLPRVVFIRAMGPGHPSDTGAPRIGSAPDQLSLTRGPPPQSGLTIGYGARACRVFEGKQWRHVVCATIVLAEGLLDEAAANVLDRLLKTQGEARVLPSPINIQSLCPLASTRDYITCIHISDPIQYERPSFTGP